MGLAATYVLGCGGATYNGLAYALEDDPALAARLAARLRAGTIDRSTLVAALRYAVGHRQERGQSPEYDQVTDSLGIWFPPIVPYRIVDEPDPQK